MSSDLVTYELDGSVALIGLNRPKKRNAINNAVVVQLRDAVVRAGEEADAGVIFGHGVNFSAGLDLEELLKNMDPATPRPRKKPNHAWHKVFDIIARGPIPFVAALHGAVVGGGLELAAAAHIRVADSTAFFGLPEGQRGIFVGGGGTVRVQRIIGYSVMADMMLTGRMLSVEEADKLTIVRYVVAAGQAVAKAKELAARIAQNTPLTNWQITNVLPRVNDLSHDDGLFMEYLNSSMQRPPELAQRLRDFIEKRAAPLQAPGIRPQARKRDKEPAMKLDDLIAIDVHTHAEVSCRQPHDEVWQPYDEAASKYFKAGKRPTIAETIAYYRERKIGLIMFTVDSEFEIGARRIPNQEVADAAAENSDIMMAFAVDRSAQGPHGRARSPRSDQGRRHQGFQVPSDRAGILSE